MVYIPYGAPVGGVNLPSAHGTKMYAPKKVEMPFQETIKHDLNNAVNEAVARVFKGLRKTDVFAGEDRGGLFRRH